MSDPNLKAMTQAELLKYLDEDFMPRLLPKLANINNLETENARLKAEVERLTSEVSYDNRVQLHVDKLAGEFTQVEVERLQAEVERLRKAGDAMAFNYEQMHNLDGVYDSDLMKFVARWNAAKEGKQS